MRISVSFLFALAISLSCIANTTSSHAKMLNCKRYSDGGVRDKSSQLEYDAKYPTRLIVDLDLFKAASGRTSISYKSGYFLNTLLSDGKLIAS